MSERRLSKLQKWILENCFRVTVLFDRSALKEINHLQCGYKCGNCPKTRENIILKDNKYSPPYKCAVEGLASSFCCHYFNFYKEDILLSYFALPPDNWKSHLYRVQHFHSSPEYVKAHVTVHRSINNLVEKGLIYAWNEFREDSVMISLTDEGIKKAAELLKIEDFKFSVES